ncbi:MAG: helix-turn-helix domain-containing protein [Victivallales bacterium]|nr:helix-turn-helix domain-containing protein [Victivallales bacterium]
MDIEAAKLTYCRKKKGLSQEELGKKLGLSKQMVSHWENARNEVPPKYHQKIAEALGIELHEILTTDVDSHFYASVSANLGSPQGRETSRQEDKRELEFWQKNIKSLPESPFKDWLKDRIETLRSQPEKSYSDKLIPLGISDELFKSIIKHCKGNKTISDEMLERRQIFSADLENILPYVENDLPDEQKEYYSNENLQKIFNIHEWLKFRDIAIPYTDELTLILDGGRKRQEIKTDWNRSEVKSVKTGELREVPVISFAQAAGYEPALEPIDDYAKECSDITEVFSSEIKPGYFALRVEGDSMSPEFPHGTNLLVAGGEFPQRSDIVVAKLRDGQVVVKRYERKNNVIELLSENPKGKSFKWHCKEDPNFVIWMYPVIEVNLKLRDRRWERIKNGNGR